MHHARHDQTLETVVRLLHQTSKIERESKQVDGIDAGNARDPEVVTPPTKSSGWIKVVIGENEARKYKEQVNADSVMDEDIKARETSPLYLLVSLREVEKVMTDHHKDGRKKAQPSQWPQW